MIMESGHALAQHMFRSNHPNCHWEVSGSYKLQLDSAVIIVFGNRAAVEQ